MNLLLNTLFVTQPGAYIHLDHDTVRIEIDGKTAKRLPLHHVGGVTVFGHTMLSPALIGKLLVDSKPVVFLQRNGRFAGRLTGPMSGNVLLRRAQHNAYDDPQRTLYIAQAFAAGKMQNSRQLLVRSAREVKDETSREMLRLAIAQIASLLPELSSTTELGQIRGLEGRAARIYFDVFTCQFKCQQDDFKFSSRSRRPPKDRINALLSFLYTLVRGDCEAALEAVGLDPQVGYLHALRPGRPALALDLMEELRPVLADKLALTLVNRQQITPGHFDEQGGGAVWLSGDGRKKVILAYQERKRVELTHNVLEQKIPWGLVPHAQARLLARHLRADIPIYPAFLWR